MITQEDIDAMEDGTGLVEGARAAMRDDRLSDGALYGRLADRIEQLERELAEIKKAALSSNARYVNAIWCESERNKNASDDYMLLVSELNSERALSDGIIMASEAMLNILRDGVRSFETDEYADIFYDVDVEAEMAIEAYRKARGL